MGLLIIRRTLKGQSHLMVNEKYMTLHFVFLLLAICSNVPVLLCRYYSVQFYIWWTVNDVFDFISALILAYIFSQNTGSDRGSSHLEIQGQHGGILRYGRVNTQNSTVASTEARNSAMSGGTAVRPKNQGKSDLKIYFGDQASEMRKDFV